MPSGRKPWTAAQRKAASERTKAQHALRQSPKADEPEVPDATEDFLARLGETLLKAGSSRAERNKALAAIESALGTLSPRDYPELAANETVQTFLEAIAEHRADSHPDDPPGTIYNAGQLGASKKRWQWRDLARFEQVTFIPNETIPVTFNGLTMVLIADQEMTIPKIFKDLYDERRRGLETARQHAAFLFRQRDGIDPRRADPSVVGPGSALVRAHGVGNTGYRAGAGMFIPGEETEEEK